MTNYNILVADDFSETRTITFNRSKAAKIIRKVPCQTLSVKVKINIKKEKKKNVLFLTWKHTFYKYIWIVGYQNKE